MHVTVGNFLGRGNIFIIMDEKYVCSILAKE